MGWIHLAEDVIEHSFVKTVKEPLGSIKVGYILAVD
jgi:hypothetical protein